MKEKFSSALGMLYVIYVMTSCSNLRQISTTRIIGK